MHRPVTSYSNEAFYFALLKRHRVLHPFHVHHSISCVDEVCLRLYVRQFLPFPSMVKSVDLSNYSFSRRKIVRPNTSKYFFSLPPRPVPVIFGNLSTRELHSSFLAMGNAVTTINLSYPILAYPKNN